MSKKESLSMPIVKFLAFSMCFSFILLVPSTEATLVLKTKDKQSLIRLEGVKTKKGAYFLVFDLDGQKKGIVQIKRVARTKAIGLLKYGSVAKGWSLEPMSKRKAVAIQRVAKKRAEKIARIQREKIKRKLARERRLAKKRKLAEKKKAVRRRLASYDEGEYMIEEDSNEQSREVLSYNNYRLEKSDYFEEEQDESSDSRYRADEMEQESPSRFAIGIMPRGELNWLRIITSAEKQEGYDMLGFGGGLSLFADISLNSFIRTELSIGAKNFSTSAKEEQCGSRGGCEFSIQYAFTAFNLKLNLIEFAEHTLWLSGGGSLMLPLNYSNDVLSEDSLVSLHGTAGGGLGLDFQFGNVVVPISLKGNLYMPPTGTTLAGTIGAQLGIAYKF